MAQRFYWKQYVTDKQVTFYIVDLILKPGEQIEAHCHDYYEFFVVLYVSVDEFGGYQRDAKVGAGDGLVSDFSGALLQRQQRK